MTDEPRRPPAPGPKLQLQMDDQVATGTYANLVLVNHSENEFILDFAFLQPNTGRARVASRIISSPKHTKRLAAALQKNIERYEERFGAIELSDQDEPPVVH